MKQIEEERPAQPEKYCEAYEFRTFQEEMPRARTDALVAKMEREEKKLMGEIQLAGDVEGGAERLPRGHQGDRFRPQHLYRCEY